MLTLVTPAWLFGLLLLPVIRWLHRGGEHRRAVPVSSLALWRGSVASTPAAGERRPPDPAWRRRALVTALIFLALAEPRLSVDRSRVTLWVDDSLSMQTREGQGTRLVEGLARARQLTSDAGFAEVEVRSLGDPWRSLGALGETTVADLSASAGNREPTPPPTALLRADALHWLLTDGADAALFDWPGGRRPDRVIVVASTLRNAGLERISARRDPSDPGRIDLLVKLTNGGVEVETREVVITTDSGEVARSTHRIETKASALVNASIPASARVAVRLEPGDALAADDAIDLDLAPLRRRRVAIDSKCPAPLVAAVAAHPALRLAAENATDVEAVLDCGSRGPAANTSATLRVLADRFPTRLPGPLKWSPSVAESRRILLDDEPWLSAARIDARPEDVVLLAAGDEPLILSRAGNAKLLETSLDLGSMGASRSADLPLLVNLMFERVLGVELLDSIAMLDRGSASVMVAPAHSPNAAPGAVPGSSAVSSSNESRPRVSPMSRDGAWPLLAIALLLLVWEIVALGRQWIRLNRNAGSVVE